MYITVQITERCPDITADGKDPEPKTFRRKIDEDLYGQS